MRLNPMRLNRLYRQFEPFLALLQRLREHFPLTLQGVITLTLMLLALQVFGYGAMDLVVFALTICAIAILMFCLFCVIFGGLMQQLRVRRLLLTAGQAAASVKLEAGYPNESGFSLADLGYFPLIKISWQVIYPDSLQTRLRLDPEINQLVEEIIPDRRCKNFPVNPTVYSQ